MSLSDQIEASFLTGADGQPLDYFERNAPPCVDESQGCQPQRSGRVELASSSTLARKLL